MTKTDALELAALTEKEYSRYEALISSGYHDNVRFRIAKFSETEKNSFDAFIKEGYNADIASKLVTMKPEDLQKFKELKEKDLFSQVCYIDGKTKDLRTEFGDWARYYIARLPDETYKKLSDFLLSEEKYNTLVHMV